MKKYIPYEKLSKREKQAYNARRRHGWGALSPVTRRPANPKAYNRNRERQVIHKEGAC